MLGFINTDKLTPKISVISGFVLRVKNEYVVSGSSSFTIATRFLLNVILRINYLPTLDF